MELPLVCPSPLQLSWFLAWVSLDQRRIEQKRNGLLPFIVHGEWQRPERATGGKDLGDLVTGEAARLLQNGLFQAAVILAAVATLSVGIWGTSQIHVEYDFVNLLPRCLAHTYDVRPNICTPWLYMKAYADGRHKCVIPPGGAT